jgi:hypothetical protein
VSRRFGVDGPNAWSKVKNVDETNRFAAQLAAVATLMAVAADTA